MASNDEQQQQPIHILFFPYIAPGHLIPVAAMAALFASRGGVKCTIVTTPVNATVIRSAVDKANNSFRGTSALAIHISTIPFPDVGLPPGVESVVGISSESDLHKLLEGVQRLREPLDRFLTEHRHPRPDAVVVDSFYLWAADVAAEHGIPRLSFLGSSLFARACNESLLRHNPFALAPDDPDAVVSLPELPHRVAMRRRQVMDPRKDQLEWEYNQLVHAADRRSYGEVFNSFAELEPDYVEHYRTTLGRRVWLVGPVAHANAFAFAGEDEDEDMAPGADRCLRWLDDKPRGSVVYLAFGTLAHFSAAELREVARGLQLSGKNFLWVMKGGGADTTEDASEWMPEGFAELIDVVGARGLIFRGWAPQRLILEHSAVGGFVTHCGWNSVLEAVSAGVPLVTWPRYADQFYNEKLVVEVLKMGVDVGAGDYASHLEVRREVISGEKIAEGIGRVMGGNQEAEAIRKKAMELRQKARSATDKGGTSYDDVGKLIHELMACRRSLQNSHLLPPSQIVSRLTFSTPSLTTRLIQKICANIVKFKSFLKNFY